MLFFAFTFLLNYFPLFLSSHFRTSGGGKDVFSTCFINKILHPPRATLTSHFHLFCSFISSSLNLFLISTKPHHSLHPSLLHLISVNQLNLQKYIRVSYSVLLHSQLCPLVTCIILQVSISFQEKIFVLTACKKLSQRVQNQIHQHKMKGWKYEYMKHMF